MGSKKLKAVAVKGNMEVPLADKAKADQIRREQNAERDSAAWAALAFPVGDTFQIARGLLDRALGLDAADRGGRVRRRRFRVDRAQPQAGPVGHLGDARGQQRLDGVLVLQRETGR